MGKSKSIKNRITRNKKKRTNKTRKVGGGLISFGNEVAQNIIFEEKKPKIQHQLTTYLHQPTTYYNKTYETLVTPDSGKKYTVFFITPQTLVFSNVNSLRVPTFIINEEIQNLKIKNRYVNYLVRIEGVWYAILRIVFALNTSYFASYTYTIFYKLKKGVVQFDENTNDIKIGQKFFDKTKEYTLGFYKEKSETIVLKETSYQEITDKSGDIFYALRKFRNVQLASFAIKRHMAEEAVEEVFD